MPTIFSKKKLGKNRLDGFYETPIKTVEYMSQKILDKGRVNKFNKRFSNLRSTNKK